MNKLTPISPETEPKVWNYGPKLYLAWRGAVLTIIDVRYRNKLP
ncbi:MAG: hypothetical protein ACP8RL_08765 [cyanobacterium endosymbiont of Rhopalodia inflata]